MFIKRADDVRVTVVVLPDSVFDDDQMLLEHKAWKGLLQWGPRARRNGRVSKLNYEPCVFGDCPPPEQKALRFRKAALEASSFAKRLACSSCAPAAAGKSFAF